MQRWREAIELAMTDEEIGSLTRLSALANRAGAPGSTARMLLRLSRDALVLFGGQSLGVHHQNG